MQHNEEMFKQISELVNGEPREPKQFTLTHKDIVIEVDVLGDHVRIEKFESEVSVYVVKTKTVTLLGKGLLKVGEKFIIDAYTLDFVA